MPMRTRSASWFDMAVPAHAFEDAAEILAGSAQVELDMAAPDRPGGAEAARLAPDLAKCRELIRRYVDLLPEAQVPPHPPANAPAEVLGQALDRLRAWEQRTEQARTHIAAILAENAELDLWREFIAKCIADGLVAVMDGAATLEGELVNVLLVMPPKSEVADYPETLVACRTATDEHSFFLLMGAREAVREFERRAGSRILNRLTPPGRLHDVSAGALRTLDAQMAAAAERLAGEKRALAAVSADLAIAHWLGCVRRIEWSMENLGGVRLSDYLAHLQGWTTDTTGKSLVNLLQDADIPAVIAFPPAPWGKIPPSLSSNPPWARPFELFVHFLGVPGPQEPDPSRLLMVIAPLLFGYMFGDLGQGAVLLLAGLLLRRRWPMLGLLISGGLSAMLFGLLFGSVFSLDHLVGPLWAAPMEAPLEVLLVPLAGGAALMVLGMLLSGVGAFWSGRFLSWLGVDAGLLLLYCGALMLVRWPGVGAAVSAVGIAWSVIGSILENFAQGAGKVFSAVALLLERVFQFGVNTLSFVRVGAFALAHAGLSLAVVSLATAVQARWLSLGILLLGNLLVLCLEGLVVFVQTTRLILFEFFTRFLKAEGREFRPSRPPATPQ